MKRPATRSREMVGHAIKISQGGEEKKGKKASAAEQALSLAPV